MNILDGGRVKETAVTYGSAREIYCAKLARMCRDVMKLKMSFVAVLEPGKYTYPVGVERGNGNLLGIL